MSCPGTWYSRDSRPKTSQFAVVVSLPCIMEARSTPSKHAFVSYNEFAARRPHQVVPYTTSVQGARNVRFAIAAVKRNGPCEIVTTSYGQAPRASYPKQPISGTATYAVYRSERHFEASTLRVYENHLPPINSSTTRWVGNSCSWALDDQKWNRTTPFILS